MYNSNKGHSIKLFNALCLIILFFSASTTANAQIITTLIGNDEKFGATSDGDFAAYASLNSPSGMVVDKKGNLYISDKNSNRIRKVNTYGIITTVAGYGAAGMTGEGGPAEKAKISAPYGLTLDKVGNLYFADSRNNRIRKIDTAGIISTVAGNGIAGFSGDDTTALLAQLNQPTGVAIDDTGNLYIADYLNNRVRKVDTFGYITTIAGTDIGSDYVGTGRAATLVRLNKPADVAVAADGTIIIADSYSNFIRRINLDGTITNIAGNGAAGYGGDLGVVGVSKVNIPSSLAIDKAGNILFADKNNYRVRKIDAAGNISTLAGNGSPGSTGDGGGALEAQLYAPSCIALDTAGSLYVGESVLKVRYVYLAEPKNEGSIVAFPNPANKETNIFLPCMYEELATVFVMNTSGRLVSKSVGPTNRTINLGFDASGVYVIYGVSKHGYWTGKVVILQ